MNDEIPLAIKRRKVVASPPILKATRKSSNFLVLYTGPHRVELSVSKPTELSKEVEPGVEEEVVGHEYIQ